MGPSASPSREHTLETGVEEPCGLLATRRCSVTDLADRLGIGPRANLAAAISSLCGCNPSQVASQGVCGWVDFGPRPPRLAPGIWPRRSAAIPFDSRVTRVRYTFPIK